MRVAECDRDPSVPVMATVYEPAKPLQDRIEVWEGPRTMVAGVRVHVKPAGETVDVNAMTPVYPLTGATVMVEFSVAPARTITLVGLALTAMSGAATL